LIYFTMEKPAWWRRYAVRAHVGAYSRVTFRSWSWDKVDDMIEKLNESVRLAKLLVKRVPVKAVSFVISPYQPSSLGCCCGDPECTGFEERMAEWGIPLSEVTEATYEVRLDDPS
jgi:hypothetical protein